MSALKESGEDGTEMAPEAGDEVMLGDAKGIFKGAEGDMAMIELKEVGGVPVAYAEHKEEDCEEESTDDAMRKMAEEEDRKAGLTE